MRVALLDGGAVSMRSASPVCQVIGASVLCLLALRAPARGTDSPGNAVQHVTAESLRIPVNESGLTLGTVLDDKLWRALLHPQRFELPDNFVSLYHRAPLPGVQLELLTPGFAGLTLHWRW